jgi:hypothetical protein
MSTKVGAVVGGLLGAAAGAASGYFYKGLKWPWLAGLGGGGAVVGGGIGAAIGHHMAAAALPPANLVSGHRYTLAMQCPGSTQFPGPFVVGQPLAPAAVGTTVVSFSTAGNQLTVVFDYVGTNIPTSTIIGELNSNGCTGQIADNGLSPTQIGGTQSSGGGAVYQLVPDSQNAAQATSVAVGAQLTITPPTTGTWVLANGGSGFPPTGFSTVGTLDPSVLVNLTASAAASGSVQYVETDASGNPLSPPVTATVQVSAQ